MFNYLDYKNRIPLSKFTIDIPKISPFSQRYEKFWFHTVKRKQIEGHWVEHNNEWKWLPGVLFQYINMWKIEMKKEGGASKGKVMGTPRLRDIEWIKGYVYTAARGFSGFKDDEQYTCHRILLDPDFEELINLNVNKSIKSTVYNNEGKLKQYKPALEYLYEYYDKNLGKPLFLNQALNVVDIECRNIGKAQPLYSSLITDSGFITMKDIKVGDKIFDNEGKLTTVLGKFPQGKKDIYELTFKDGRKVRCSDEHLWKVYHRQEWKVVDLNYILSQSWKIDRKNNYTEYYFRIPIADPIQYPNKDLLLDPYVLGIWLGDGASNSFSLYNVDDEVIDRFNKFAINNNYKVRRDSDIGYHLSRKNNKDSAPINLLRKYNLIKNKHIPEEYFTASIEQRLDLLRGLMDTDGTIDAKGYASYDGTNYRLVKDVERLCWTLGIATTFKEKKTSWIYKGVKKYSKSYRLFVDTPLDIFYLNRKLDRVCKERSNKREIQSTTVAITNIEYIGKEECACISVSNDSKLYLTDDYVVTHNTMITSNMSGHNFLTDGIMDYDAWWENYQKEEGDPTKEIFTTQTLIGANSASTVANFTKHLKKGLEHLPGKIQIGEELFPAPLSKKFRGSWVAGKDIEALYDDKVGNNWVVRGSGSGFLNRTFKDNEFAANGTRYGFGVLDEVGFLGNLIEVLGQLHECTTVDGEKYGTIWMTGTGGDMDGGATEAVKKVFYKPSGQDCMEFDDIFEGSGRKIGFFVPAWMALDEFRDEYGNVNKELALKKLQKERDIKIKGDKATYNMLLQMKPLVPSEAFLTQGGNIFNRPELQQHIKFLETTTDGYAKGRWGTLAQNSNRDIEFMEDFSNKLQPCPYPIEEKDNKDGCVVIWEEPIENPPYGYYIATLDPYAQDESKNSASLGSMGIFKRANIEGSWQDVLVAEYTARPETLNEFMGNCMKLMLLYNAHCLYESNVGELWKAYMQNRNLLHMLFKTPTVLKNNKADAIANTYGLKMTNAGGHGLKEELKQWTRDWLFQDIGDGKLNLHNIYSVPLLKELEAYNEHGNFDRVIMLMLFVAQKVQMHKVVVKAKQESKKSWIYNHRMNGVI